VLVDYLRYVAFEGRLRAFFQDAMFKYVDQTHTTGQHLRFDPAYLDEMFDSASWYSRHQGGYYEEIVLKHLMYKMGLEGGPDGLTAPRFKLKSPTRTFIYKERRLPNLQIIIDIDPYHWGARYSERREYDNIPIIYRRSSPAMADFESGEKLFDKRLGPSRHGTLCGFFEGGKGKVFALTCGHVTAEGAEVAIEQRSRIWKLPLWSKAKKIGQTRYVETCNPVPSTGGALHTSLDAALIEVTNKNVFSKGREDDRTATVMPISGICQESPVRFRGSGRIIDTLARISAVTVRKSIDLFRNGELREVGDVLMLGHRNHTYITKRVSRRGDSGAAVRQDVPFSPYSSINQWYGMVLGSDDGGAYATYSEHLWTWVAEMTNDSEIEFVFAL